MNPLAPRTIISLFHSHQVLCVALAAPAEEVWRAPAHAAHVRAVERALGRVLDVALEKRKEEMVTKVSVYVPGSNKGCQLNNPQCYAEVSQLLD